MNKLDFFSRYERKIARGTFNINYIPRELDTQEVWEKIILINYSYLSKMPKAYTTTELLLKIISKEYGELNDYIFVVLEPYLNQRLCNAIAAAKPYLISKLPAEYVNKDTCFFAMKEIRANPFLFVTLPEELLTEEFCLEMSPSLRHIANIPARFRTKEICTNIVLNNPSELAKLNSEYIDKKLINKLIDTCGKDIIRYLPKNYYLTADIYERIFEVNSNYFFFKSIPKEYRTIKMWQKVILDRPATMRNLDADLPSDIFTGDFLIELINSNPQSIKYIPERFLTKDLLDRIVEANYLYLRNIPPKYIDDDLRKHAKIEILKSSSDIIKALNEMVEMGGSLESIAEKKNIPIARINSTIEALQEIDNDLYEKIKTKLTENRATWAAIMVKECNTLVKIINSLDTPDDNRFLIREQKLKFCYLYYSSIKHPPETIYSFLSRYQGKIENSEIINNFFKKYLKYCRVNDDMLPIEKRSIEYNNKWLRPFSKAEYFNIVNGVPTSENKYLEHVITEFDIDEVTAILKKENVPLNDIIVKESIRKYFDGTLLTFIKDLHSYDTILTSDNKTK